MKIIENRVDINRICEGKSLPEELVDELERYLCFGLTDEEDAWTTYDLKTDGPIIVLEPGVDDPRNLKAFGMTEEYGGVFAVPVEFTQKVTLESMELYKTLILLDNSFCLTIFNSGRRIQHGI